jgi:hypothetical protein
MFETNISNKETYIGRNCEGFRSKKQQLNPKSLWFGWYFFNIILDGFFPMHF